MPENDLFGALDIPADEPSSLPPAPEPPPDPEPVTPPAVSPSAEAPPADAPTTGTTADTAPAAAPVSASESPPAVPQTVPLATYLELRKETREDIAALRAQIAELKKGGAAAEAAATPEPNIPDYMDDPKGYTDGLVGKLEGKLKALEETGTKAIEETREQAGTVRLMQDLQTTQEAFVKDHQDYPAALQHLRQAQAAAIQLEHPEATPQQILAHIALTERQLAARLLAQGRNPAEVAYGLAKSFGYTPKTAPTPAPAGGGAPGKGGNGVVPPDTTLGKAPGGSDASDATDDGDQPDILAEAMAERFGVRKRA